MTFFELSEDERKEWRQDPVTRAFLDWLAEQLQSRRKDLVDAAQNAESNLSDVRYTAGVYKGTDDIMYAIRK